jgi:hypothetical protein
MKEIKTFVPLALLMTLAFASTGFAQEVLPFPPASSGSTAGLTMKDSTYKKRVDPSTWQKALPTS